MSMFGVSSTYLVCVVLCHLCRYVIYVVMSSMSFYVIYFTLLVIFNFVVLCRHLFNLRHVSMGVVLFRWGVSCFVSLIASYVICVVSLGWWVVGVFSNT